MMRSVSRVFSEIYTFRGYYAFSFFAVLSFLMSGFICTGSLSSCVRARTAGFFFGGSASVIPVFFALLWKRGLTSALSCLCSVNPLTYPASLFMLFLHALSFSLSWGCALGGFLKITAAIPLLAFPYAAGVFAMTRSFAFITRNFFTLIAHRRFFCPLSEALSFSSETVNICLSCALCTVLASAAEAIAAAILQAGT